jgi:hypothetical protein
MVALNATFPPFLYIFRALEEKKRKWKKSGKNTARQLTLRYSGNQAETLFKPRKKERESDIPM